MNSDKARDFFSAYYEGSLDSGLKLALEQKFKSDEDLRLDYEAFSAAFADLDTLRDEEIEIPIFLSDRIATRIEEARQNRKKSFLVWNLPWFKTAPNGLALVAIICTVLGMAVTGVVAQGGFIHWPTGHEKQVDLPTFRVDGSKVTLVYQPRSSHSVVIKSGLSDTVLSTIKLEESQPVEPRLNNQNPDAKLFTIQEDSEPIQAVAVPGTNLTTTQGAGEGSLGQFALAVSNYYHVPVLLENVKLDTKMKWNLDGIDASKGANSSLQQVHLSADLRADGMLSINGH